MSETDSTDGDSSPTTHYSLLEVSRDASEDEIVAAYRAKALEHHPDVSEGPQSEQYMTYLNRARETLLDPDRRAAYDAKLEEMGIEPESTTPPGQTRSARPPRRESMEYFIDRGRPVELDYPDSPFEDRVLNLAVRSWSLRSVLALAIAVAALELELAVGGIDPFVPPLSTLLVGFVGIFALDALRVVRRYPRLIEEAPTISPWALYPSVRLALLGAALWTGSLLLGGDPHAFAGGIVFPLAAGAIPVALLCRYFSLPRRLLLSVSAAAGATVALPFLANAPVFLPAEQFPTTELTGLLLGGALGLLALIAIGVGIGFGGPMVSHLAWEVRCRSSVRLLPQVWEVFLVVPIAIAALSLSAGIAELPPLLAAYASATVESGVTPALAGFVLAWTLPAVALGLAGRLWLGRALTRLARWGRDR